MKALYIRKHDVESVLSLIKRHDVDTLVVNAFGLHEKGNPAFLTPYELESCCSFWKDIGYTVYISILWNSGKNVVGDVAWIDSRFNDAAGIYHAELCDGILCDVENYNNDRDIYQDTKLTPEWKTHIDRCRQWLSGVSVTGQMPHRDVPGLLCYPNDMKLFLETTYGGIEWWAWMKLRMYQAWNNVRWGLRYELVPGLYVEDLGDRIEEEKVKALNLYGGYWVYSDNT